MKKLAAVSRADLLRCLSGAQGLDDAAALLLGYQPSQSSTPIKSSRESPEQPKSPEPIDSNPQAIEPRMVFPTERPRLTFLAPVKVETLKVERPSRERGDPITDAELAVDWSRPEPRLPPLARWARLAPFLRNRLGTPIPGTRLDVRKLMRQAGSGLPLTVLPRLQRAAWAAQAVILWDVSPEMFPFAKDAQWLIGRLKRERGPHGLDVRQMQHLPNRRELARLPAGVPVLALSAMGQFLNAESTTAAWAALAHRLAFQGQPCFALNPCPRDRWQAAAASAWPSAVWDRRPRLPRHGGLSALPGLQGEARMRAKEELLDILSPASRVEGPLLRSARLRLGKPANAGTEWDAWHHEEGWHSIDCFGFRPGPDYAARLERRKALSGSQAKKAQAVAKMIANQHEAYSSVIAAEADLRACLSGSFDGAALAKVTQVLQSAVDRLRLLAAQPASVDGRRSGLPDWFVGMVDRLTGSMRGQREVRELIAQGLALAHAWGETTHTLIPAGVDGEVFRITKKEASAPFLQPVTCRVDLVAGDGTACCWLVPNDEPPRSGCFPLADLRISNGSLHFAFAETAAQGHSFLLPTAPSRLALPALVKAEAFTLESDLQRLHLAPIERPAWASRMYYDRKGLAAEVEMSGVRQVVRWATPAPVRIVDGGGRGLMDGHGRVLLSDFASSGKTYQWIVETRPPWAERMWVDQHGLAAQFSIQSVPFVLRWIPPGWFLMGSPQGERGRWDAEGPQHEVTLSQGFWLAESTVTQVQWRAVALEAAKNASWFARLTNKAPFKPEPSHFEGPDNLPVESVTWHECVMYCQCLNQVLGTGLPAGFKFALPTEAQWEYACRAGTTSAFSDGSPCTLPKGNDPALDRLGWFDKNSGNKTQAVKQKPANAWGLHDMHGNVWEWCADVWTDYPSSPQTDPQHPGDDSALRVMRGGSWDFQALLCRAASRDRGVPGLRWDDRGLRLAAGQEQAGAERPSGPERRSRGGGTPPEGKSTAKRSKLKKET